MHLLKHSQHWAPGTGPKADFSKAARSRPCAGSAPNCSYGPEGDCGRHCFSETGSAGTWEAAALPCEENGGCSFWRMDIPFADGRKRTFWRRERPHLAMEAGGTIAALTTGTMDARVYMYDDNAHRRATQRVPMGTDIATSVQSYEFGHTCRFFVFCFKVMTFCVLTPNK